jgi:hypothetical protein
MSPIRTHIEQKLIAIGLSGSNQSLHGAEAYGYMHGVIEGINRAVTAMQPKDNEQRNAALEQLKRDTIEIADIINACVEKATT